MRGESLKRQVRQHLHRISTPGQYLGGEVNCVFKDPKQVLGRVCLPFPDTHAIGQSRHGLQVLYSIMNNDPRWHCERAFTPWLDIEALPVEQRLPLYSLETFTPLCEFDVVGFSFQYEVLYTSLLTMLYLSGIPLASEERGWDDPLVIAGGPGARNPEVMTSFVGFFVVGDSEESLPWVMEVWMRLKHSRAISRTEAIARLVSQISWGYAPAFYEPSYNVDGTLASQNRTRSVLPAKIHACGVTRDFDGIPLPTTPFIPFVKTPHDRVALEIMRGCPWQCRFCQSTVIKRPLRVKSVDTVVAAAMETYKNTGCDKISLLSLSSSDYPYFEDLVGKMAAVFGPLGGNICLPSLRVNSLLRTLPQLVRGLRKGSLTLAPEVSRDDMREQIRKKIKNEDLYEGCRQAFRYGWRKVKLYFLCGLPEERRSDLEGIVEMAETIGKISREETGGYRPVVASVSNFVPKPHTPYQLFAMQDRQYFSKVRSRHRLSKLRVPNVEVKQYAVETSMPEGVVTRGDRSVGEAVKLAWSRGAQLDGWRENFQPKLWWQAFVDVGIDPAFFSQRERPHHELLLWDHIETKRERPFLENEHTKTVFSWN